MLFFAHLGLTLAAAQLLSVRRVNLSMAFVALGSILPDIIDKPLGYVIYGTPGMGRIYAHTLLFLMLITSVSIIIGSKKGTSLAFGVFAHLILDFMWLSPIILFWPLLGDFPVHPPISIDEYLNSLLMGLTNPIEAIPEILGLAYLIYYIIKADRRAFLSKTIALLKDR